MASAAGADVTPPYGPFGFSTMGLGVTSHYGEPSLAVAPDGVHELVSTPGGGGVNYWYSADGGKTWKTTSTSYGGGDSALDFLPDGTAVSADLSLRKMDSGITVSHDFGKTWGPIAGAGIEQDRQWLAHTPDQKRLFLVYHDLAAEAEFISQSTDGGKTWTTSPNDQIFVNSTDQGTALPVFLGGHAGSSASIFDQGVNTFSGPMLVAPNGKDFYVVYSISDAVSNVNPLVGVPPFGPVRALVVAHSGDAGANWTNYLADVAQINGVDESIENTLFPWGFLDSNGTVYVVFDSTRDGAPGDHFHQYYIYSKNLGATWSNPFRLDTLPIPKGAAAYAAGDAVSPGVIDVGWYQSDTGTPSDDTSTWVPHFAQVTGADTKNPTVIEQAITTVPNHHGGICIQGILCGIGPGSGDRSLLDFFMVKVNPVTGMAEFAYADNYRLGGDKGEVVVAHQTTVPTAAVQGTQVVRVMPNTTGTRQGMVGGLAVLLVAVLGGAALGLRRRRLSG